MKIPRLLFVLLCLSLLLSAQQFTLNELIVHALKHSPDIRIYELDYQAAKERHSQAFGGYLPKLDLSASATHVDSLSTPLIGSAQDNLLATQASLSQLLFDFGKTSGAVGSYKKSALAYNASLKEQIIGKKRDVKLAYYNILKNMALILVNEENLKLNKAQLYRSKRYFEAGIRTKIDISDARVRVVKAEIALKNSRYDLQKSYAVLERTVGFQNSTKSTISLKYDTPDFNTDLYHALPKYPLSLHEAILYAWKHKPLLEKLRYQIQSQKERQKHSVANYYPSLYMQANYEKTKADTYDALFGKERWDAGIYMNWNLFSGGADRAKISEQKALTQKSFATLQQQKLAVKEEVTKAYIALEKSYDDVRLSQSLLNFSKEKFEQVSKQYEHGLSDYIELQEARQGYIDAKSALVVSYYNYYGAIAIVDATIGK